jgi:hypothetical protein
VEAVSAFTEEVTVKVASLPVPLAEVTLRVKGEVPRVSVEFNTWPVVMARPVPVFSETVAPRANVEPLWVTPIIDCPELVTIWALPTEAMVEAMMMVPVVASRRLRVFAIVVI